ncbi:MAG: lipoyl(octanoyl) transferase LipB [Bacteroidales bacterium]|nr:lipoyl(octanoyl) transferase LipB [Bacteroidales bacterium]
MNIAIESWGVIPYAEAWSRQKKYFEDIIQAKLQGLNYTNRIVICEHTPVYTLGKSGAQNNMLLSDFELKKIGVELYHIDRGGDITYHGPGQIVCYPLLDLESFELGLRDYIQLLEESVIRVCARYGIEASRLIGATGVWLDVGTLQERKICAMGIRCSHFVTMHGLALNVNTDLKYFNHINPCGFQDKGVTSMEKELGHPLVEKQVAKQLAKELVELLQER